MGGYDRAGRVDNKGAIMINVSQDVINEYLRDSSNKELIIAHEGVNPETVNYYTGDITIDSVSESSVTFPAGQDYFKVGIAINDAPPSGDLLDYMHAPLINDWEYLNISFYIHITSITDASALPSDIQTYVDIDNFIYSVYIPKSSILDGVTACISIPRTANLDSQLANATDIKMWTWFLTSIPSADVTINYVFKALSVNYTRTTTTAPSSWIPAPDFSRIKSLNPYTIDNDTLLYESFSLTESLCSQDNLKFGLCEAAHIEFDTVEPLLVVGDEVKPITRLTDYAQLSDDDLYAINWIASTGGGTQIAIGDEDFSGWINVINPNTDDYIADWSDYINVLNLGAPMRVYEQWLVEFSFDNVVGDKPVYFKYGYGAYFGDTRVWYVSNGYYNVSNYDNVIGTISTYTAIYQSAYGTMSGIGDVWFRFYDADKNVIPAGEISADITISVSDIQYRVALPGHTMPAYSEDDLYYADGTLDAYIAERVYAPIPLGVFYVSDVQKEYHHNFIKRKATAYDRLVILENNAADWYTRYMFGIDFDSWVSNGFQFARQIFATYLNYTHEIGLEPCNFTDNLLTYTSSDPGEHMSWTSDKPTRLDYWKATITDNIDTTKYYKAVIQYKSSFNPANMPDFYDNFDALGRGVCGIGDVLVEETLTGGGKNRFLCNSGDYFILSDDCVALSIYYPYEWARQNGSWTYHPFLDGVAFYVTDETKPHLVNDSVRLCYYNYGTKEIFACDSSITGRDVVRSLLEVCGCFYRLSRKEGEPEFVYPQKGGLYPSNTLFPADDLYPRQGMNEILASGKYMSLIAEDYEVKDFGRIQILKNVTSSDTVSVVEWQYEGNSRGKNTYVIDDNIFYCNDNMEYDYDGMPEVSQMLAGMWNVISNLGYVPNETQALGAPWLECGDRIGLLTYDGGFETFIFRRTLKGIQNLRDTYESYGDELNNAIDNFGYSV